MPFFPDVNGPWGPESMKFPVNSLLAGNSAFRDGFARDCLLQRRVTCEPEFLDQTRKVVKCSGAIIDLYYWTTPNGHKVTIFLKETGLAYRILPVNISKGEQFKPDFLRISQQSDPCDRRHRSGGGRPAGP